MKCDFCSDPHPVARYDCPDFNTRVEPITFTSHGGWAACTVCSQLIDLGDMEGLFNRAIETFGAKYAAHPEALMMFKKHLRDTYEKFFRNKRKAVARVVIH